MSALVQLIDDFLRLTDAYWGSVDSGPELSFGVNEPAVDLLVARGATTRVNVYLHTDKEPSVIEVATLTRGGVHVSAQRESRPPTAEEIETASREGYTSKPYKAATLKRSAG